MVKLVMRLFVVVFLLVGCATTKEKTLDEKVSDFHLGIKAAHKSCDKGLFLDFNLSDHPVVIVFSKEKKAFLEHKGKLQPFDLGSLPPMLQNFPIEFNFYEVKGKNHLLLYMDKFSNFKKSIGPVNLGSHEGFHGFFQVKEKGWSSLGSPGFRGTVYPVRMRPRYYRWMMSKELNNFIKSGDSESLGKYSFWYSKWKKEYPEEQSLYLDRTESVAEYVGLKVVARINSESCVAGPRDVYKVLKRYRKDWFDNPNLGFSSEAYYIGVLASITLDLLQAKGWEEKVKNGLAPQEVLADMYKSINVTDKIRDTQKTQRLVDKEMKEIDSRGFLKKAVEQFQSKQAIKLFIKTGPAMESSAFTAEGMYNVVKPSKNIESMQLIELSSTMDFKNKRGHYIKTKTKPLGWFSLMSSPCGEGERGSLFVFDSKDYAPNKSRNLIKFQTPELDFKGKVKKVSEDGHSWLCVE